MTSDPQTQVIALVKAAALEIICADLNPADDQERKRCVAVILVTA